MKYSTEQHYFDASLTYNYKSWFARAFGKLNKHLQAWKEFVKPFEQHEATSTIRKHICKRLQLR